MKMGIFFDRKLPFPGRGDMGVPGTLFQEMGIRGPVSGRGNPKIIAVNSVHLSELPTHDRICTAPFEKGCRPQRGGTNLGVFVPIWPVMRMPG